MKLWEHQGDRDRRIVMIVSEQSKLEACLGYIFHFRNVQK